MHESMKKPKLSAIQVDRRSADSSREVPMVTTIAKDAKESRRPHVCTVFVIGIAASLFLALDIIRLASNLAEITRRSSLLPSGNDKERSLIVSFNWTYDEPHQDVSDENEAIDDSAGHDDDAYLGVNRTNGTGPIEVASSCAETVPRIEALHESVEVPSGYHQEDWISENHLNLSTYFNILQHLSIPNGQVLDYIYVSFDMGGKPILYVRDMRQDPFLTFEEYHQHYPDECVVFSDAKECKMSPEWCRTCPLFQDEYLNSIHTDGSPESYMEFVVLSTMGGKFQLDWHASFAKVDIVWDLERVEEIIHRYNDTEFARETIDNNECSWACCSWENCTEIARNISWTPTVEFTHQDGIEFIFVRVAIFTEWGEGFYIRTSSLGRANSPPNVKILSMDWGEKVIPYYIGVVI